MVGGPMHLAGHMSVAYLAARAVECDAGPSIPPVDRSGIYVCAVAGAVFPDAVDKYYLYAGFTPFGRTVGHSILVLAAIGLAVGAYRFWSNETSAAVWFWFGYASHFGADIADDFVGGIWHTGFAASTWPLWPLWDSDDWYWEFEAVALPCRNCYTILEILLIVAALVMLYRSR